MSIVHTLKKFIDPITARREEADFKGRIAETTEEHSAQPVSFTCRVCDLESSHGGYCPDCLADTMVPTDELKRERG